MWFLEPIDFLNPSLEHQKSGSELAHPQNSLHTISSSFVQAEASIQAATLCVFWEVTQERAMMILDHFPEESGSERDVFFFWGGWARAFSDFRTHKMRREIQLPKTKTRQC